MVIPARWACHVIGHGLGNEPPPEEWVMPQEIPVSMPGVTLFETFRQSGDSLLFLAVDITEKTSVDAPSHDEKHAGHGQKGRGQYCQKQPVGDAYLHFRTPTLCVNHCHISTINPKRLTSTLLLAVKIPHFLHFVAIFPCYFSKVSWRRFPKRALMVTETTSHRQEAGIKWIDILLTRGQFELLFIDGFLIILVH
jgi:hypothetical protein